MNGPKKQADKLNIVWVLSLAIMGGAFVYASFVALQALYLADAEALQMKRQEQDNRAAYDALLKKQALSEFKKVTSKEGATRIVIPIEAAMEQVVTQVRTGNPANLVPAVGSSNKPTVPPIAGRPSDNVQAPAEEPKPTLTPPGAGDPATPGADGVAPAGAAPAGAAPAGAAPAGAAPAGAAPAGAAPAGAAPAGAAPAGAAAPKPAGAAPTGAAAPKPAAGAPAPKAATPKPAAGAAPAGGNAPQ